jgi:hypothetical protein
MVVASLDINGININMFLLFLEDMAGAVYPDMFQVPVAALHTATREVISTLLNPLKVIPTDEDIPRQVIPCTNVKESILWHSGNVVH